MMRTYNLDDSPPSKKCVTFRNFCQRRFFNNNFAIEGKKYFIDFSYVIEFTGNDYCDCDRYSQYISKIYLGYYLDRKTEQIVKAHIWIKDYETNKRAAPEVYAQFKEWLEKNHNLILEIEGNDDFDEDVIYDYPDLNIFEWSEVK